MYDEQGATVWHATLSIWGQLLDVEGPRHAVPFRWPGQYEDAETGLYYNRWRYYDPESGAYVSQDPLGLRAGLRAYAYPHDPTQLADALGLIHESTTGYNVYVIADKATGEPIYVGITDDIRRRTGEHTGVRYDPDKHVFVPVVEDVTYGEARGAEQALMEDLDTKVKSKRGTFPNNINDSVAADRLDNPSNARERAFSDAYDKHKGVTHNKAREDIDRACGS
jgi:RHS repeat-associated protein